MKTTCSTQVNPRGDSDHIQSTSAVIHEVAPPEVWAPQVGIDLTLNSPFREVVGLGS